MIKTIPIFTLAAVLACPLFAKQAPAFPEGMIPAVFAADHEAQLAAAPQGVSEAANDETSLRTDEVAESVATLSPEAEADLATWRQQEKRWQAFLNRWDVDGDADIDGLEYQRYAEWLELRQAVKGRVDVNGNGKFEPAEREAFRDEVNALNARYFEGEE